jgi:endo-1,4-beta-D-glucanase Y
MPGMEGFTFPDRVTINPCYYLWSALDTFVRADPRGPWRTVVADGEFLLKAARFGTYQLPTDWIDVSLGGVVSPADGRPPRFGYDAIRVPLYAVASGRTALIAPIQAYWRALPADAIPAWIDVVSGEVAEYSQSDGARAVVNRVRNLPQSTNLANDYYAAVLQCLAVIL